MQDDASDNPDSILRDYDEWHRQRSLSDTESPLVHPWHEMLWADLRDRTARRVLEIGCGRGVFANWLSRQRPEFEITALDFSGGAIEIAQRSAREQGTRVEFVVGDAEALPFEADAFDLVISCECMEHVPHPPRMAREMARVLRPGGRYCLTTPSYLNGMLIAWLYSWLRRKPINTGAGVQPRENFQFFWNIRRYLRDANLEIERTESCNYQWLLLPRVAPAKLCTLRFESRWARALAKPFGVHFAYFGRKP